MWEPLQMNQYAALLFCTHWQAQICGRYRCSWNAGVRRTMYLTVPWLYYHRQFLRPWEQMPLQSRMCSWMTFSSASLLHEIFYQSSSTMDALSSQIRGVRLFILRKDFRWLRKAETVSCHPASKRRDRTITRGSCMPQFRKHVLFLPHPLANIAGIPSVLNGICNSKCVFLRNPPWNWLEICREANERVAKEPLSPLFREEALGGICHCSLRCSHNIECIIHLWLFGIVWWGTNASCCSFRSYRCLYHTENPMNNVEDKSLFVSVTWPPPSRAC